MRTQNEMVKYILASELFNFRDEVVGQFLELENLKKAKLKLNDGVSEWCEEGCGK